MILRAIFLSLGPYFLLIPIIIYVVCKFKYKNEILPEGYASFEKRSLAYMIDNMLYLTFDYLVKTAYLKLSVPVPIPPGLIIFSFSFLNIIVLPSVTGWSIGKRITSIKIVKKDDKKAAFIDIVYREIVKDWFSVTFAFIGCVWMLFGKNKLTWHDSVADTRVIKITKEANKLTNSD